MSDSGDVLGYRLDRFVYTHSELLSIAKTYAHASEQSADPHDFVVAIVFAAFAFEAHLNFLGEELFGFWDDIERVPAKNKLNIILKHVQFEPDLGARPYQSLLTVKRFRDMMAHARSEDLSSLHEGALPEPLPYPMALWEQMCASEKATRLVEDVAVIMMDLHHRSKVGRGSPGLLGEKGGEIMRKHQPGP